MSVQSRKERERQDREKLILSEARRLLLAKGFQALSMDELAAAIEYSKGTLYLHFKTKEELALAVTTDSLRERADLFELAAGLEGSTRDRMSAIGFACCEFAYRFPEYFHIDMMLQSQSFWERASKEIQHQHTLQSGRCFRTMDKIVREAMLNGELPDNGFPAEKITFSLICLTVGTHLMGQDTHLSLLAGGGDPGTTVREQQEHFLDRLGWKPESTPERTDALDQRIRRDLFPDAAWQPAALSR